jgi:SAM-dependent methyltransferase
MRDRVLRGMNADQKRWSALDVGCGPGLVMGLLSPLLQVEGLDQDPRMVRSARERGFDAVQGDALALPFDDRSFDVVYCSFTLLWISDPQTAVREMSRVARRHVVFLAEPDYGGRICVPGEVAALDHYLVESMEGEGADPYMGRKIGMLMERAGLKADLGVHSGTWTNDRLSEEADAEWDSIVKAVGAKVDRVTLEEARKAWTKALEDRSLFLFNPVFYAIGSK